MKNQQPKRKINKMIFITRGNVPSKAANTLQLMKMAAAFSKIIRDFRLLINVSIFHFDRNFNVFNFYDIENVKLLKMPFSLNRGIFFPINYQNTLFKKLAPFYAKIYNPDVIYTRVTGIARTCLQLGLKVVLEHHNELPNKFRSKEFNDSNFLGCITISQKLKNSFIKKGMPKEKIIVEHSGVALSNYEIKENKLKIRKDLNFPTDKYIITYSGHLYDYKGIPLILKTAKTFKNDIFLLFGGWEHDIEKVKAECKRKEINNVICYGYVKPKFVPKLLYASDLLLLPTSAKYKWSMDTSPLKMFEYMASGTPIVASNLNNISTVLKNKKNALLFEPDSFEEFKEKISFAKENRKTVEEYASQARLDVTHFDWNERARRIIEFIEGKNV